MPFAPSSEGGERASGVDRKEDEIYFAAYPPYSYSSLALHDCS